MSKDIIASVTGIVVSDDQTVSLVKLCKCCDLAAEQILTMVDQGIIEPLEFQSSHIHWQFTGNSVLRVQTAIRLQRDLGVNLAGAALALDLLDEIKMLRRFKDLVE
jgi:chaperone modulatory protein CbpM